jgi:bifunctional non-homologous end joining protein LigD
MSGGTMASSSRRKRTATHRSPVRFTARMLPGARPGPFPGFIVPCAPTLKAAVPTGERWLYEIKHDGYRVQAHLVEGKPALLTSSGLNWTGRFRSIAQSLGDLPANSVIMDGEVVVPNDKGIADFSLLQAELAAGRSARMLYYVFDLLFLDGFDLRAAPLIERRRVLAELLPVQAGNPIVFSAHLEGQGQTIFDHACAMGLEGLVCKLRDSPYRSGRSQTWLKVKCVQQDIFTIVGFVSDGSAVAALHLARREGKALVYVGKAGTGFSRKAARELHQILAPLAIDKAPVATPMRDAKSTWVRPQYQAVIAYRAITGDRLLRHAAYKRLYRGSR